ncbi:S-layer homology domain-containing protein [Paenibacillus turpanensis]|uniref:S-layer homology domain-containing protein n=1 Tax=Paenibacillus turpanensis TaxID=2689078 RepID=UPI00140A09F3|nr:S-layer homology domain-containing protein [Paenibacillus turpanensis]
MKKSMKALLLLQSAIVLGATASFPVQKAYADHGGLDVPFVDVKSHWSADSVMWAVGKNIVSGYEDGTFKPDQLVTEAEFLSMLIHSFKPELKNGSAYWAEPYYKLSASLNYPVDAQDSGIHSEPLTRLRVAELIASTQGKHYDGEDSVRFMYSKGLAQGEDELPTIAGFNGSKTLTRAEAVQFIKNLSEQGGGELLARPEQASDPGELPLFPSGNTNAEVSTGQAYNGSAVQTNASVDAAVPVLKLDDQPVVFRTKPVVMDGMAYYPIEDVCAAFGIGYEENGDGSVTTTILDETNTFQAGDTEKFVHYNPDGGILQEEDIPLDGEKPMRGINGVYMIPAESLDHIWFAVKNEATRFADMLVINNGQVDESEINYYTYKQFTRRDTENKDGSNRQPFDNASLTAVPSEIERAIWVKQYRLPSHGTLVYATWRWNYQDSDYYKFQEIKFTGKIVDGVATGVLRFEGDVTYYQENDRFEQYEPVELYDVQLPYENVDLKMTWNDAFNMFAQNHIELPQ